MNQSFCKIFFLQMMNITNITKCLQDISETISSGSIRLLVLQTEEYPKYELADVTEIVINNIHKLNTETTFFIANRSLTKLNFGSLIGVHMIISWNTPILNNFLNIHRKVVARNVYKIFLLTSNQPSNESGILHNQISCSKSLLTTTNTDRFPLKVTMFVKFPTAILEMPKLLRQNPIYKSHRTIGGLDGFLLKTMADYLNFDVDIIDDFNPIIYGEVLPNGTITGSLATIANNEAHISTNGRFLVDYGTDKVEFTIPYETDRICAIVPKSMRVPQWLIFVHCFDTSIWLALGTVYLVCCTFWYYIGPSRHHQVFWQIFTIFVGIPANITPTHKQLFFLFGCIVLNIIILSVVQSSLIKAITTPTFYKEINTLDDLDKAGFPIATKFYTFDNASITHRNLRKKQVGPIANILDIVAYQRNMAKIERERDLSFFIRCNYLDEDGTPLLHILKECFTTYFISYIVPKGSALLHIFNKVILRLVEGGLTIKWYNDVQFSVILEKTYASDGNKSLWRPYTLYDIQTAFFLWLLGSIIAILTFVGEICRKKLANYFKQRLLKLNCM
ncbi:hypothetical protein TcasGA2_TC003059 [Tribolium castaneum]|uniref:Ionotropic glutamate receptor C-terminal domain-containing protein n=1 Tax=Tribolium castaneum TaxID=7070 RepID=D6WFU6_TRICA|nr:hypothetical protein TcasGA2_TC003059 [Tribolium castaneum]